MNELAQLLAYATKVFGLWRLLRGVGDRRHDPPIPTRAVLVTLLLGVLLRIPSYSRLAAQTRRRRWQHLIHYKDPISHDTLEFTAERLNLADLRSVLLGLNKTLKANKALESCKINGLLFLSLDANEHFHSRSRCCPACCQRELEETDAQGQKRSFIQYYHRYVFAQINGPKINPLLDLEPIRPGEAEAEAALRLLGRIRRLYGVRFFDAISVDAWYVQSPFLKAVQKMGWDWIVVLKQERFEVLQEARALSHGQKPAAEFEDSTRNRQVRLWSVKNLTFGPDDLPVQVVHSEEKWIDHKILGGKKTATPQSSDWWWLHAQKLEAYPVELIYQGGHRRWGIENKAFNELTQGYHLEHCYHHEPIAMLAQMLILLIGFTLFNAFAKLHSQAIRLEQTSLVELAHLLDLALEADLPWDLWFASG